MSSSCEIFIDEHIQWHTRTLCVQNIIAKKAPTGLGTILVERLVKLSLQVTRFRINKNVGHTLKSYLMLHRSKNSLFIIISVVADASCSDSKCLV